MPEILEAEAARAAIEAHALDRPIRKVETPDAWFIKRGATPSALRSAITGRSLTAARRRGKQLLCDTSDDGPVLGLHLGMSGRVLIDGVEAGDPLLYASNRDDPAWRRFGLRFADGGVFWLRDPRRLGAVQLDMDEDRLGPDAMRVTRRQIDGVLGSSQAPLKAVLMDQARLAGLGNLLTDEALWFAGLDPARPAGSLDSQERARLLAAIRRTLRVLGRRGGSHTGELHGSRERGGRCPRDGAELLRRTVGGRTTYSCPLHQE